MNKLSSPRGRNWHAIWSKHIAFSRLSDKENLHYDTYCRAHPSSNSKRITATGQPARAWWWYKIGCRTRQGRKDCCGGTTRSRAASPIIWSISSRGVLSNPLWNKGNGMQWDKDSSTDKEGRSSESTNVGSCGATTVHRQIATSWEWSGVQLLSARLLQVSPKRSQKKARLNSTIKNPDF